MFLKILSISFKLPRGSHPLLMALLLFSLTVYGVKVNAQPESDSKLDVLIDKTTKLNFHYYAISGQKSFILMNNTYQEVDKRFYIKNDQDLIPKGAKIPEHNILKRLIEIARIKQFNLFLKNGTTLFTLTPKDTLVRLSISDFDKYFPPVTDEELAQDKGMSIEEKEKLLEQRKNQLAEQLHAETALLPGWHKFKIDLAFKQVSADTSSTLTNYFAIGPYYVFERFPVGLGITMGGNMLRSEEKTFLTLDTLLTAFTFYKMKTISPALSLSLGKQTWIGLNASNNMMQMGLSIYFPAIFYIQEAFLQYATISRPSPDPQVKEIKIGIGIHLF